MGIDESWGLAVVLVSWPAIVALAAAAGFFAGWLFRDLLAIHARPGGGARFADEAEVRAIERDELGGDSAA